MENEVRSTNQVSSRSSFPIDPLVRANVSVVEGEDSKLLGKSVENEVEAFKLYNDYAYGIGFSIRYHNKRYKDGPNKELKGREFCCSKYGIKQSKGKKDKDGALMSIYWRDAKMKKDYIEFNDVVGHDTTFRTNKHDMICAPFVGINSHTRVCMFGCGFLLNERTESFVWLFNTFLRSMGGIQPTTIMTDQSSSMAAAIPRVFPNSRHRLCTWHILKNAQTNIRHLFRKPGFNDLFGHVLMYCDSIQEFNHYWNRMMVEYNCLDNSWLSNLYKLKEKWCPAYSKEYFSAGILSSQRSETTNKSISEKLFRTASLCDFYNCFCEVISKWRKNEGNDNYRSWNGYPELAIQGASMLMQAATEYTIDAYKHFEEQYMIGMTCFQQLYHCDNNFQYFRVWRPKMETFSHSVKFDVSSHNIWCTCKKFEEGGFLCCHCLRVYNLNCVTVIPTVYLIKRWLKREKECDGLVDVNMEGPGHMLAQTPSIWKAHSMRQFYKLLCAGNSNRKVREVCDDILEKSKAVIEAEVGRLHDSDNEPGDSEARDKGILNPKSKRQKGEKNVRKRSISEKKTNAARSKAKIARRYASTSQIPQDISNPESIGGADSNQHIVSNMHAPPLCDPSFHC